MKLLVELSMECESLARSELLSAAAAMGAEPRVLGEDVGVVVLDTTVSPQALASRLGLCHYVSEWIGSCDPEGIEALASEIDVPGPIRVRSTKVGEKNLDLASASRRVGAIVGRSRGVDLHSPVSDIRLVFSGKAHVGRAVAAVDRTSFEKRKNRYMPYVYPASLHPKYARALVNLTRVRASETLLDPFCGTGAIVAEAAMIGLNAHGTDIAQKMIEGARRNLDHLGLRAHLSVSDVGNIGRIRARVRGIATDPPYGRSTSTDGEGIPDLLGRAFAAFAEVLDRKERVAIVIPEPALLEGADRFRVLEKHELWVHRSLTRHFCVLEKR